MAKKKIKLITPQELQEVRKSVDAAREHIHFEKTHVDDITRAINEWDPNREEGSGMNSLVLNLIRFARSMESSQPKLVQKPILGQKPIVRAICKAALTDNFQFFLDLAKTLSESPPSTRDAKDFVLANFLVDHWAEPKDGLPPFFCLSPAGLARVCQVLLKRARIDWTRAEWAIVQERKRLKLKTLRRAKFHVNVHGKSELEFIGPDGRKVDCTKRDNFFPSSCPPIKPSSR